MRSVLILPLLAVSIAAAQPEKPDDLLKPAIAAAGGAETLLKYRAGHSTGKGTMSFAGVDTPFTCEQTFEIPGKLRTVVRSEVKGQKWEFVQVFNGESAKQTVNSRVIPATELALKEMQFAALLNEVAQLVPLGNDKRFTVKIAKPEKPGEPAGLTVQARGHPDLRLTFDRKTSHLARIAYKSNDPDTAKEADTEMFFSDFKTVSGLTRPTRTVVTRDGKTVLDLIVTKRAPLEKVDAGAFAIDE